MKTVVLLIVPLFASIAISALHANETLSNPTTDHLRFMVTLSEYQLEDSVPVSASEADILGLIQKSNVQPTETIRLSVINDVEGMVQFGKRVTVTVGKTVNTRDVTSRQTQHVQVGTLLKLTLSMAGESVIAQVAFESSRLQGEGTDDSPPDMVSATISTTQILELGKPRLMGSTSSGQTSFVFMTVTRLP